MSHKAHIQVPSTAAGAWWYELNGSTRGPGVLGPDQSQPASPGDPDQLRRTRQAEQTHKWTSQHKCLTANWPVHVSGVCIYNIRTYVTSTVVAPKAGEFMKKRFLYTDSPRQFLAAMSRWMYCLDRRKTKALATWKKNTMINSKYVTHEGKEYLGIYVHTHTHMYYLYTL